MMRKSSVDFPAPVVPTMATVSPGWAVKEIPESTSSPWYEKETSRKTTSPRVIGVVSGRRGLRIVASCSGMATTRFPEALARLTEVRMCPIIMREKRIWKT